VQDSAQALWIAVDQLRRRLGAAPAAENAEQESRRQRIISLGRELDGLLTPFGMVRGDWRLNSERVSAALAGVPPPANGGGDGFERAQGVRDVLLSWRSMMPRRAHDDLARLFVRRQVPMWILRTNQIPGSDPDLEPLAPTLVLGQVPVLSTLLRRVSDALFTPFGAGTALLAVGLLLGYGAVVIPMGLRNGFLHPTWRTGAQDRWWLRAPLLLAMPALVEELIFRVALLPHPLEGVAAGPVLGWSAVSLGLFVAYHPLAARLWYRRARRTFDDARFLVPCALLGVVTTIAYEGSGSLWPPLVIHWLVVLGWLRFLGGTRRLEPAGAALPERQPATQG
jgi:predicted Abi (CAAX) family protease